MRDHEPITLDEFNGLWRRGDPESCPIDHFPVSTNISYVQSGFETRPGVDVYQGVGAPLGDIVRFYNYLMPTGNTLLVLTAEGEIFHVINSITVLGPILAIDEMEDFAFCQNAGHAYISPFKSYVNDQGQNVEKGLEDEFTYVYLGDGVPARKAAGSPPVNGMTPFSAANSGTTGFTDAGFHLFAVIYETDTGFDTALGPEIFPGVNTLSNQGVTFEDIPVSPDAFVTKRHIVGTRVITNYNGDQTGYIFYFIPGGTIDDNTTTELENLSFFDADLLDDASHLIDNYAEIPAVVTINTYNNRMCFACSFDDISLILVSFPGEPEAISQLDGLIIVFLDGNPITNLQELRDVLYVFKRARTIGYVDNGDVPTSWEPSVADQGVGCGVHGIGVVLDSGGVSADYLAIASFTGVQIFQGRYSIPELSWKIQDFWLALDRNNWRLIQVTFDTISQILYLTLPDGRLLVGNYSNGLDPIKIRWSVYVFDFHVNTIALIETNKLILGSERRLFASEIPEE